MDNVTGSLRLRTVILYGLIRPHTVHFNKASSIAECSDEWYGENHVKMERDLEGSVRARLETHPVN